MKSPAPRFVSYLRVSTQQQGASGLGIEAQRAAIAVHVKQKDGELVAEFREVESGKKAKRPQLRAALAATKQHAATLVVAKLDRLSRNVTFLGALIESDVSFVALDLPAANRFTLHVMAAVAEQEARATSERTKAALAAAKARGVKLGGKNMTHGIMLLANAAKREQTRERYATVGTVCVLMRRSGSTLAQITAKLNTLRDQLTPERGGEWHVTQIQRILKYAEREAVS
jgi:DNA invertase Pin-like site-specific DNA recombinase